MVKLKRAYDKPSKGDGLRILVERLWPRGLSKDRAALDLWMKDIAPSAELRKWFSHDPSKWREFKSRYARELKRSSAVPEMKQVLKTAKTVTFVYAARDQKHNGALALKAILEQKV